MDEATVHKIIDQLAETHPAPWIARETAKKATGGVISAGTLANLDTKGEGPDERFYIGRKACYPLPSFIEFLKKRAHLRR